MQQRTWRKGGLPPADETWVKKGRIIVREAALGFWAVVRALQVGGQNGDRTPRTHNGH